MKTETLKKAEKLNKEMQELSDLIDKLDRSLRRFEKLQEPGLRSIARPIIRFANWRRRKSPDAPETEKATIFLFDTTGPMSSFDAEATPELVEVLRGFYQKKLDSKKEEFENLKD